jgi:hypothetical protein
MKGHWKEHCFQVVVSIAPLAYNIEANIDFAVGENDHDNSGRK